MAFENKGLTELFEGTLQEWIYERIPYSIITIDNIYGELIFTVELCYRGRHKLLSYFCHDLNIAPNIIEQSKSAQKAAIDILINQVLTDLSK